MGTCSLRGVTSALPASWEEIGYLMEFDQVIGRGRRREWQRNPHSLDETQQQKLLFHVRIQCERYIGNRTTQNNFKGFCICEPFSPSFEEHSKMENENHTTFTDDPKIHSIISMMRECYESKYSNHSSVLEKNEGTNIEDYGPRCPRIFDGFACWDETPAGTTAYQPCPYFVVGFDPRRYAYKRCTENGTWYIHSVWKKLWTNYTLCVDIEDLDFRNIVNNIYVTGYSISVAALLVSMTIFLYFRTLQCTRIRIHMHLFMSFTMNNILWIIWYNTVVKNVEVLQLNMGWCQILHVVMNYFMVASYIWMFCEGLHLHIALVVVFVKDDVAMRWFVSIGWGIPFILITTYSVVRYTTKSFIEKCWMDESDTFWIIIIPVLISLIASFVFLIHVVRVLITKLHPGENSPASLAALKAVRAALILVPLFGLHFMLLPLRPLPNAPGERVYQVVSALITSLQGLCLSVLFCFTNHDVWSAIKMQMARLHQINEAVAMTGMTAGESLVNTRENIV